MLDSPIKVLNNFFLNPRVLFIRHWLFLTQFWPNPETRSNQSEMLPSTLCCPNSHYFQPEYLENQEPIILSAVSSASKTASQMLGFRSEHLGGTHGAPLPSFRESLS